MWFDSPNESDINSRPIFSDLTLWNRFGEGSLRIASIDEGFEQTFWDYIDLDPLDYYFFILDLKQRREQTKILLALKGTKVEGLMLVFADYIVQLRGSRKAVEMLLDRLDLEKVELQAPPNCEDMVLAKYAPQAKHEMILMRLRRGEENIQVKHELVRLGVADADRVAEIMRKADREWWGEVTAENLRDRLEKRFWLGIKRDGKIVSVGSTQLVDSASNIGVIATDEEYRNMGFATSVTSALAKEILKKSSVAIIHVLADNALAVHVYSKVGFKPYRSYLSLHGELIRS
jgi:predicted GNAT family acetyltransferase